MFARRKLLVESVFDSQSNKYHWIPGWKAGVHSAGGSPLAEVHMLAVP